MTGVIMMGSEDLEKIRKVARFAEDNPLTMDDILDIHNGALLPAAMDEKYRVEIPFGYVACLTVEQHLNWAMRHLSVTTATPGKVPSPEALQMVMDAFGFKIPMMECKVWMAPAFGGNEAVHIMERATR